MLNTLQKSRGWGEALGVSEWYGAGGSGNKGILCVTLYWGNSLQHHGGEPSGSM